jgi:hypothetical protein
MRELSQLIHFIIANLKHTFIDLLELSVRVKSLASFLRLVRVCAHEIRIVKRHFTVNRGSNYFLLSVNENKWSYNLCLFSYIVNIVYCMHERIKS